MGVRQTTKGFIANARAVHGDRYDYSRVQYVNNSTKVEIICSRHGAFWPKPLNHIQNRSGCPACAGVKRTTLADFVARAREQHGDFYDYSQVDYRGVAAPVMIVCPRHGPFRQIPYDHVQGHGCKACGVEKCAFSQRRSLAQFIVRAREFHGDRFDYSRAVYVNSTTPIEIICPEHGSFWQSPYFYAKGVGCPACAREQTTSQGEQELADWIESLGLTVIRNDRTVLDTMEVDIVVPEKKLGIEYNGAYWHSAERLPNARLHEIKVAKAQDAGIRLVTVWDFDWETRPAFVQTLLRHQLGLSLQPKFNARACAIRLIDAKTAAAFYRQTHIQGPAWRALVNYGLFYCDDLVAAMSFSQGISRRGKMGAAEWELIRFATRGVVRGGASKLFAAFLQDHAPQVIWSFSDRQYFSGQVYSLLGFQEDGRLPADYRVVHQASGRIWHKSAWQRQHIPARLTELGIDEPYDPATDPRTERDMQAFCRALRIMDAGKIRWKWAPCP